MPISVVRSAMPDPVIAFVSGESLIRERRAAEIRDNPELSGEELIARLDQIEREAQHGEYREVTGHKHDPANEFDDFGSPDGDRFVWIDDAPDEQENPSGHFEAYDSEKHGGYHPIPSLREQTVFSTSSTEGGAGATPAGDQS